jgi:hypothetical protein
MWRPRVVSIPLLLALILVNLRHAKHLRRSVHNLKLFFKQITTML